MQNELHIKQSTPKKTSLAMPKSNKNRLRPLVASRIDEIQSIEEHSERTEKYSKMVGQARKDSIIDRDEMGETYFRSVERY